MQDQVNATSAPKRVPWNKGKLTVSKPPPSCGLSTPAGASNRLQTGVHFCRADS